jgi:hypothetical protein
MNWLRDKFRRSHADEQLDREIAFHVDELTRDNIGRGMTSTEARRQAVLQYPITY